MLRLPDLYLSKHYQILRENILSAYHKGFQSSHISNCIWIQLDGPIRREINQCERRGKSFQITLSATQE